MIRMIHSGRLNCKNTNIQKSSQYNLLVVRCITCLNEYILLLDLSAFVLNLDLMVHGNILLIYICIEKRILQWECTDIKTDQGPVFYMKYRGFVTSPFLSLNLYVNREHCLLHIFYLKNQKINC